MAHLQRLQEFLSIGDEQRRDKNGGEEGYAYRRCISLKIPLNLQSVHTLILFPVSEGFWAHSDLLNESEVEARSL